MSTTITGTLVDALGQPWGNAQIRFFFQPQVGVRGPYIWSGGPFDLAPPNITYTDVTGKFTAQLPSNNEITPIGSKWQIIVGPNATYPAFVFDLVLSTGALDISALFASKIAIATVQSQFVPRAYRDSEVVKPPNSGQIYYDAQAKTMKYWEDGVWNPFGSGSGGSMVYPPAGIAVSTGSSWAASLDPSLLVTYPPPGLANSSGTGWLLSIDPNTLQRNITLTTNGNAGPATFAGNVLNIPQYAGAAGGMVYPARGIGVSDGSAWVSSIPHNANASGAYTVPAGPLYGLNLTWNLKAGLGETVFINNRGGGAGGFSWYNATDGTTLDANTPYAMFLNGGTSELTVASSIHSGGSLFVAGNADIQGTVTIGNGTIRIGDRGLGGWNTGTTNINSDRLNLVLNATGNGAIDFNLDQGTGGVQFCNGAGGVVSRINSTGDGSFNGAVGAGRGYIAVGWVGVSTAGSAWGWQGETTYLDSAGSGGGRGSIKFRIMSANAANVYEAMVIGPDGVITVNSAIYGAQSIVAGNNSIAIGNRTDANRNPYSAPNTINGDSQNLVINSTPANGSSVYFNFDQGNGGIKVGNGAQAIVASISGGGDYNANGGISVGGYISTPAGYNAGNAGYNLSVGAKFWSDGGTSFLEGAPNGRLFINYHQGEGAVTQVTGVLDAVTRLNTNSFTIGNTGINGYVLMGNGSSYVPQPLPVQPSSGVTTVHNVFTGGKAFNTVYPNTSGKTMYVSGAGYTDGGHVGSVQALIGPDSTSVSITIFAQTSGASVINGVIGWFFIVPVGWWYKILANSLTNNQGSAIQGIQWWNESY